MPKVILLGRTACDNQSRLTRLLQTAWNIVPLPDENNGAALQQALPQASAFIGLRWKREWMEGARQLRLVQALGAGVDAYDVAALPPGCALCNVYGHGVPVAEYVIGAMVALTARFAFHDARLRQGHWDGSGRLDGAPHAELARQTVGLIGWGSIGREVARRARAFGMSVRAIRAHPQPEDHTQLDWVGGPAHLEDLLAVSDYLVVCCPLNSQTRGMLNEAQLKSLKPGAYLINVARAEVIEEAALFAALQSRRLAGAALDVWYRYPDSGAQILRPSMLPFHELDNVLMTPHLSAWTEAMIERRWQKIAANLDALSEGHSLENVVHAAAENRL
jgi:phosphoglycerate dehydrogenase-like enzyme